MSTLPLLTITIDDIPNVSSKETGQASHSPNNQVVHKQPRSIDYIRTQDASNPPPYSSLILPFKTNRKEIPGLIIYGPKCNPEPVIGNIFDVQEYMGWSIFNAIFCCILIGGSALWVSCLTRKHKRLGDILRSQNFSKASAALNVIGSISGLFMYILAGLQLSGYISM